jgi:hypothetical protein
MNLDDDPGVTASVRVRARRRVSRQKLSARQREALDIIVRTYRATREPCSGALIARQMNVHHSRVQAYLSALYLKGWLVTPNAPATPTRS